MIRPFAGNQILVNDNRFVMIFNPTCNQIITHLGTKV